MSGPAGHTDETVTERLERVEARLRELEDEREIRELLSRYGYHADAQQDEAYLDLFTDDGAMDISMGREGGAYASTLRFEGKDALRDFIADPAGHHAPGFYGHSMHAVGVDTKIHVEGDNAVATAYSILLQQIGQEVRITGAGTNRWTFRRVDGHWMIVERRRREVGHPGTAENLSTDPL